MIDLLTDVAILFREHPVTMGVMLGSAVIILITGAMLLLTRP